jgi:hypothetical protein
MIDTMHRLAVLCSLAFACGSVKHPSNEDGGGSGDGDGGIACEAGQPVECQGNDIVVCGQDGASHRTVACDISCDPETLSCTCEPNTSICEDSVESVCGEDGHATPHECSLGCFDETRCAELDATNRLTQFLDEAVGGPDLVLTDGTIIDTDDQEIIVDGLPINVTPVLLAAPADPGGIQVLVFAVSSLTITGDVLTRGQPALAFVSDGDVIVNGVVRVLAGDGIDGRGAGGGAMICSTDPPMQSIGGHGGGGFGGRGGDGGDVTGATGGAGGAVVGNEAIVPLRGGGSNPSVEPTGGALQLVSRTRITFIDGGAINAGGNAGSNNGSAGGAGGGIVLEAPVVVLSGPTSALAANGGGGGCGNSGTVTASAEEGRLDSQRAAGCQTDGSAGDGGRGGAGSNPNGLAGETISGCAVVAGSGGGGVGRIRINNADGAFAPTDGAIISPPASVGSVGRR